MQKRSKSNLTLPLFIILVKFTLKLTPSLNIKSKFSQIKPKLEKQTVFCQIAQKAAAAGNSFSTNFVVC